MLGAAFANLLDFLFPKAAEVYKLESLTASELLAKLPSASDLGTDTLAIFSYADSRVRELIWELKYRKNAQVAESLATIAFDILKAELAERALFDNFTDPLLLPMPMSSERRRDRGWNQTEVICEALKGLDTEGLLEYSTERLIKVHHTESQTLMQKRKRLENLDGSMQASGVEGRNVILLDDVTTTGATIKEARRALRAAGSKRVLSIVLAH